jgi:rfaE bifunctional protein kinase chain/domain
MKEFVEAIQSFKDKKIAVIGDVMLDRTERGYVSKRKNPEKEEVKIVNATETFYLGGAGNVARNLVSLEAGCDIYGIVGDDVYGDRLNKMFAKEKIGIEGLLSHNFPTIVKARIFENDEYEKRSDLGEKDKERKSILRPIRFPNQRRILGTLEANINNYDAIILSDYNKRVFSNLFSQEIISLAKKNNLPVIVDAKPINMDYFSGCTVVCPNEKEAKEMTRIDFAPDLETLAKMSESIKNRIDSDYVVITCGENGIYVYNNGKSKMMATQAKEVVEVTGAGDTVTAVEALGIASGLDIYDSSTLANYAAGIAVGKIGTHAVTQKELLASLNQAN